MTSAELLVRARRTAVSARLLFEAGGPNGACNRAYYAIFDAARAALLASDQQVKSETIKTHSGLITAFSQHLVKPGHISVQHGKAMGQVDQVRLIADYSDEEIDRETVLASIEQADHFVEAVAGYLEGRPSR